MIEGIKEIGEIIIRETPEKFLETSVQKVSVERKGKKQHIVIIEFDTAQKRITFDFKEIKEETAEEYLWIGNASGNTSQDRLTTTTLEYLVSQTIPNLISKGVLKEVLEKVRDEFYYNFDSQKKQGQNRYKYMWNLDILDFSNQKMDDLKTKVFGEADPTKEMVNLITKEINNYLKNEKDLPKDKIGLYTVKIDGKLLIEEQEYKEYLLKSLIEERFDKEKTITGICHICDRKEIITYDTTQLQFSYYITDKIGFSSGIDKTKKGFIKNFGLCKDCYSKLMAGEKFIANNLSTMLAGTNLYIIPKFIFDVDISASKLKKWSEYITSSFNSIVSIRGIEKFQASLEDYLEFEQEKNSFILNFLFYKRPQPGEFRILNLIQDVPPSRLDIIRKNENKIHDIAVKLFDENDRWYINLEKMYYLLPVRMSKGKVVDYKKVLELYDCLFSSQPVSYRFLINQFVELVCVYRFEKFENYNIKSQSPDIDMVYAILEANVFLIYLRRLGLLEGGETMDVNSLNLKDGMKEYIKEMGYNEPQVALFLLGYLIGEIGNAQYSKENPSKPILNKITYQGMNIEKIKILTIDVFEKLKQYKSDGNPLLTFNEGIFSECKRLIDRNIENWKLSEQENVFYVLSGYAYATHERINIKKKREEGKFSSSHPFFGLIGKYKDTAKDVSEDKYKYLSEAYYEQ